MKREHVLKLFAALDLIILARFHSQITSSLSVISSDLDWSFVLPPILSLVFLVSLLPSSIGLLGNFRWAIILNYFQFPFRLGFLYLSFGFITWISVGIGENLYLTFLIIAVALEFFRLWWTIRMHRGYVNG